MNGEEIVIAGMTQAERDALMAKFKATEAARVAAMTPEERAAYDKKVRAWEALKEYLAEPVTMTRGEIREQEIQLEQVHEEELAKTHDRAFGDALIQAAKAIDPIFKDERQHTKNARTQQGALDRKLEGYRQRIAELEAALMVARATMGATNTLEKKVEGVKEKVRKFEREDAKKKTGDARTHQSAQDKKIAKLEAQVAKLTEERDAALKARDEMLKLYLDQQAKRTE